MAEDISNLNIRFNTSGYAKASQQMDSLQRKGDKLERGSVDIKFDSNGLSKVERDVERIKKLSRNLNRDSSINVASTGIARVLRHVKLLKERLTDLEGRYVVKVTSQGGVKRYTESVKKADEETKELTSSSRRFLRAMGRVATQFQMLGIVIAGATAAAVIFHDQLFAIAALAGGIFANITFEQFRERLRSAADSTRELRLQMSALYDVANDAGVLAGSIGQGFSKLVAASDAAGNSLKQTIAIARGFTVAAGSMGVASSDINDILADLVPLVQQGTVKLDKLKDVLAFTNDPAQVLADSLGMTVEQLSEIETVSGQSLLAIANHLAQAAEKSNGLNEAWNRLVNTFTQLLTTFNTSGVLDALIQQLNRLSEWAKSSAAQQKIKELADVAVNMINAAANAVAWLFNNLQKIEAALEGILVVMGARLFGSLAVDIARAARAAIVARTAFATLGATMYALSGPIGWILGALSGLALWYLTSSENSDKLTASTKRIVAAMEDQKRVMKELQGITGQSIDQKYELAKANLKAAIATRNHIKSVIADARAQVQASRDVLKAGLIPGNMTASAAAQQRALMQGRNSLDTYKKYNSLLNHQVATIRDLTEQYNRLGKAKADAISAGSSSSGLSFSSAASTSAGSTSSLPKTWSGVSPGAAMANAQQLAAADRIAFLKRAQQAKEYWDSRRETADNGYDYLKGITEQAGRNMQNAFADFLFKPMENGFKGMVQGFIDALRKMAANLLASKIFQMLGSWGNANAGGGFVGTIATMVGGLFGGGKATGGPVSGGTTYLVGERGPELFTPSNSGSITPNNAIGGNTEVNVYNYGNDDATVERERGPDGKDLINVFIGAASQDIAQRGPLSRTLQSAYGLKRQGAV